MKICIDIDNTLLNYEPLFFEESTSIPEGIEHLADLKTYLQEKSQQEWLNIQGRCYGKRVLEVNLFEGALESLSTLIEAGHEVFLVSHKTKNSYCGNYSDLQGKVLKRLNQLGVDKKIPCENIFLQETLEEKLLKISSLKPDVIIDDLEKVIHSPVLEDISIKILFSRFSSNKCLSSFSWSQVTSIIKLLNKKSLTLRASLSTGNNSVYKLSNGINSFVLKAFSKPERYKREKEHLALLNQELMVLDSDDENLLLLTNFLSGSTPKSFNKLVCDLLTQTFKLKTPLFATHRRVTIGEYNSHINDRLSLKKEHYVNFKPLLETLKERSQDAFYKPRYEVFCPPDMSLDNFLDCEGRLQLLDLESSGMDDPLRTLGNALFHSRNKLDDEEILELFSFFNDQFPGIFSNSFELVLDLVAFDWLLLEKDPSKSLARAKIYENRLSSGKICFSLPEFVIDHVKRISPSEEL